MQPTTTAARVKRGPRGSGFATFIIMYYIMRVETSILEAAANSRSREAESRMNPHARLLKIFFISDSLLQDLPSFAGRGDFVGGIDNEALDFSQLEDFINSDSEQVAT